MKLNILEKQKPINRNKKNIFKNILNNTFIFIIFFIGSIGLLMLGALLDKI
jgi:hypothetical protein